MTPAAVTIPRRVNKARRVHTAPSSDDRAILEQARTDLVLEHEDGPGTWGMTEGPFRHYRRSLTETVDSDGRVTLTEETEFKLAVRFWGPLFLPMLKRALSDLDRRPQVRWWWPSKDIITERSATLMSVVAVVSVIVGYLGVIISQTITFAADEFGVDESSQGRTLAAVRIGIVLSVIFIRRADRIGRRPLLIGFTVASILLTALGALAQSMVTLGVTQALARGLATGLLTLITLSIAEEVPAAARSLSIGLITLSTGFGAALVVWVLPVADVAPNGWRVVYLVPLLGLPVMAWVYRTLPETRRFDVATSHDAPDIVDRRRFVLLAFSAFASSLFLSPASQFMNQYLNNELGFSAGRISVFRLAVGTPVGLFILGAGYLADRHGRRPIGVIGIAVGCVGTAAVFFSTGLMLWVVAMAGSWMLAGAYTTLRGYQTELFPTRSRARVGGWIDMVQVTGSAIGLLVVGELAVRWGRIGPGLTLMLIGPAIVMVLLITHFPETAKAELEDFNPNDPGLPPV